MRRAAGFIPAGMNPAARLLLFANHRDDDRPSPWFDTELSLVNHRKAYWRIAHRGVEW
jgi:hypothetical protein